MPTGRPDYWYGTALYFTGTPSDGEVTRGPTADWAYDHVNNANAHHIPSAGENLDHGLMDGLTDDDHLQYVALVTTRSQTAKSQYNITGPFMRFYEGGTLELDWNIQFGAGRAFGMYNQVTPGYIFEISTTGNLALLGTVDGVDIAAHAANGAAHHTKYIDSDAVSAMGAKGDANSLNHDKYTDAKAELACEAIVDDTPVDGATDQPVSSNWAFDHAANADAHHIVYVDRGDPATADWDQGDLTMNNAWQDLDLSSIVPVGALLVLVGCSMADETPNEYIEFRENGNSNEINTSVVLAQVANITNQKDCIVACDAGREIEYRATSTLSGVNIVVRGWWI